MPFRKPGSSGGVVEKLIVPLAVLAVERILKSKRVKPSVDRFDRATEKKAKGVVKAAGKRASKNRGLVAGSAAAFAVGLGLLFQAGRKR